ncbi:MAG: RluA family pseudouridine synthase [Patescibacteria group bacterium]
MLKQIKIIFEDQAILVLDKPCGVVVNDSETVSEEDLVLENYLAKHAENLGISEDTERKGIVHRLDKETSGVLIIAKNNTILKILQASFKERLIKKTYLAVVNGSVPEHSFTVNAPIARNPKNRFRFAVVSGGKQAITAFEKIRQFNRTRDGEDFTYTLLKAYPLTGRTHQIRVHLTAFGNPIAGDRVYEGRILHQRNEDFFKRLMLHAYEIEIKHPVTGEKLVFTSPIPKEFKNVNPLP